MEDLIYDRTKADADYAEANPNATEFLKGSYGYVDLNRVENWCEYLANILNNYGYLVNITAKTDWSMKDKARDTADMERIRQNVNRLKEAYFSFTQIPENLEYMTINKANGIERILHELDYILMWMENHFIYSGVANSGQVRTWQQRFRRKYSYFVKSTWEELDYEYWNELDGLTFADKEVSYYARNTEL